MFHKVFGKSGGVFLPCFFVYLPSKLLTMDMTAEALSESQTKNTSGRNGILTLPHSVKELRQSCLNAALELAKAGEIIRTHVTLYAEHLYQYMITGTASEFLTPSEQKTQDLIKKSK